MVISKSRQQITLFLDPDSYKGKQTRAYALTNNIPVQEINICKTPLTGTQLVELAGMLRLPLAQLVNKESLLYKQKMDHTKLLNDDDWIKVMIENQELIRSPIVIRGDKAMIISTPTDILQL